MEALKSLKEQIKSELQGREPLLGATWSGTEREGGFTFHLNVKRITGLALAISTIFHNYPDTAMKIIELLL